MRLNLLLLLGDRLFGTPSLIAELLPELESGGGGLLFRVKANMKSRVIEVLPDGSRLVCLSAPRRFGSVGSFYRSFAQVSDADVTALLETALARTTSR